MPFTSLVPMHHRVLRRQLSYLQVIAEFKDSVVGASL